MVLIWKCLATAFFSLFLLGCTTAKKDESHSDLFIDPAKRLGERVVVRGFLHWRLEDRSLYPTERDATNDRLCLPVLIKKAHKDLLEMAKARDGAMVEISGRVVNAAGPGKVSVFACRQSGIEVESIR